MTPPKVYLFEGEMRTLAQIRIAVPALGENAIKARLQRGMTTRTAMLAIDPAAGMRAGGRRGRAASGNKLSFARNVR